MVTCPQCSKLNPENFNYCLDCGAELHPEKAHSAESNFFIDLSALCAQSGVSTDAVRRKVFGETLTMMEGA